MPRLLLVPLVVTLGLAGAGVDRAEAPPAHLDVGRWHLQSNAWVNLNQRLLCEAQADLAPLASLRADELARWKAASDAYRSWVGRRSPVVDPELAALDDALAATDGDRLPPGLPAAPAAALAALMPIYRAREWPHDDRVNRFWMATAEPLLRWAGEELAAAHARAYGVPFPTDIRVDAAACGWKFGGYTVGEGARAHVVIAANEPGYQGFRALEMLLHEPSHAIVGDTSGAIGGDLVRLGRELRVDVPWNLWHAVLFYTSSELTRRALADRGVDYRPVTEEMWTRGFAAFEAPLRRDWQAYLDGALSREEALRRILLATGRPKEPAAESTREPSQSRSPHSPASTARPSTPAISRSSIRSCGTEYSSFEGTASRWWP